MLRTWLSVLIIVCPAALAAPKAETATECEHLWDAALVARALAINKVNTDRSTAILTEIYGELKAPKTPAHERVASIMRAIINAAQVSTTKSASEFAAHLSNVCYAKRGNMDSILGVTL